MGNQDNTLRFTVQEVKEHGPPAVCKYCRCEIRGDGSPGRQFGDAEYASLPSDVYGGRDFGCCTTCRNRLGALDQAEAVERNAVDLDGAELERPRGGQAKFAGPTNGRTVKGRNRA